MSESVAAFLARGGKIQTVDEGTKTIDPELKWCKCGCNGNRTDHNMRRAENQTDCHNFYYR